MTEVRISSLCERPCAGIEETGEAPSDAGGMECSRRRKVHSLIDKVYDPANLAEAWKRVRENKGSAGIDGLTVAGFEQRQDELLDTLHKQLREKTYRPSPVKRVAIPKLGGGTRNLGIPSDFLEAGVIADGGWEPTKTGVPQGGVASPLWSNIFLTPFDHAMTAAGYRVTRWADDFVVVCRTRQEAQTARALAGSFLRDELGVSLHPEK